jgi:uncharacterized protein YwqG
MKTKEEALTALKSAGLPTVVKDLEPLVAESIRIIAQPGTEQAISVGSSKLGGLPDLPPGVAWPAWKDTSMSFIAQFDLAQVSKYDTQKALPQSGILYFFFDSNQQDSGSEPVNRGQWKVVYHKGAAAGLQRLSAPGNLPPKGLFKPCTVQYATEVTLPLDVSAFGLTWEKKDLDRYSDFMSKLPTPEDRKSAHHRLLGHPDQIQDDMHLQVALEARGRKPDQVSAEDTREAQNWRLLFQVDSDERAGMNWANNGMLYYWIHSNALKAQDFGNVWLVMQSE